MFVRFTPQDHVLHLEIDPQDLDAANQPMPTFEIDLTSDWQVEQQQDVFVILFQANQIMIEIDTNDVLTIWELLDNNPQEVLYSTPIVSPQLADEVRQQFRNGMPFEEILYSRFVENNEMNNASTLTANGYMSNRGNISNTNVEIAGGYRRIRKSRNKKKSKNRKSRRQKKRTLRSRRSRKSQ